MRILQVIPDLGQGGAERVLFHLVRYMRERADVRVVSLFAAAKSEIEVKLGELGVPLIYLGKRLGADPRMVSRLWRVIRDTAPDVVHTHRGVLKYAVPAIISSRRAVFVHTMHNVAEREVDWSGRLAHRLLFGRRVAAVAIADEVARTCESVYRRRPAAVIPNGIPVVEYGCDPAGRARARAECGITRDVIACLCVARLSEQKNIGALMRAVALARRANPAIELLIVGDGPDRETLRNEAGALSVSDNVRFLGERRDIPRLLSACDMFVLASRWEGSPLTVMEAMAAGRAVICSAVGGVPEIVEDGRSGLLVRSGDVGALAGAIIELAKDPDRRAALGRRAAEVAQERFDVTLMGQRYLMLYEQQIGNRGTTSAAELGKV